jgi:hypothetical protein
VLALILGLIHVAPLQATPITPPAAGTAEPGTGYIRVHAIPWANVTIDDKTKDTTPRAAAFQLTEGKHRIVFQHDAFAPIEKIIEVPTSTEDNASMVTVDFCKQGTPIGKPVENCGELP